MLSASNNCPQLFIFEVNDCVVSDQKKAYLPNLNPALSRRTTPSGPSAEEFVEAILKGDRVLLSRAITLVESRSERHRSLAQAIVEGCLPHSGRSLRLGITGSPGVGKSTFIERLGLHLIGQGRRPAVLAIDPSSPVSRGSILGDKTRMEQLAHHDAAYIRPSPAGESLGGVARKTRETVVLCEAAGYDTILVETVGVGQSETAVHSMVDCFLLLLLPGAGDELQGIKRGIVEMADLIAINKADGARLAPARQARQAYRNALHLFPPKESGWTPRVVTCSALDETGIDRVWDLVREFEAFTRANGSFIANRREQARYWLRQSIEDRLRQLFFQHPEIARQLPVFEEAVLEGGMSSFRAADELMKRYEQGLG